MKNNRRVICIVVDSLGVGGCDDSLAYNDHNPDTFGHICDVCNTIDIKNLKNLGLTNLHNKGHFPIVYPQAYYHKCHEQSKGKDTITGHYEIMGIETKQPYITFTEFGFPPEMIKKMEELTGHTFIGNYAASGTQIIKDLGEQHLKTGSLILYTSADSVLQIAAHEEKTGLEELYRTCQIIRELSASVPEWKVGRVIARPFVGKDALSFVRTSNRHDYALNPPHNSVLDDLKTAGYEVVSIGKINDIFNGCGIAKAIKSKSSENGMQQTIDEVKRAFSGLIFTNLVDFDALWGHRRNIEGYAHQLEIFDSQLSKLIKIMNNDDLLIICADHGNDPSASGSDHTREYIPVIYYSKQFKGSGLLPISDSFASIGATICDYLSIKKPIIGKSYLKWLI